MTYTAQTINNRNALEVLKFYENSGEFAIKIVLVPLGGSAVSTATTINNLELQKFRESGGKVAVACEIVDGSIMKVTRTAVNTATYTALDTDELLGVTRTATGACTITLPSSQAAIEGRFYTIKDEGGNASSNNITIVGEGGETIDGAASAVIGTSYMSLTVYSTGTAWMIK